MTIAFTCSKCRQGSTVEVLDNALPITIRLAKLKKVCERCLMRGQPIRRIHPTAKQTRAVSLPYRED